MQRPQPTNMARPQPMPPVVITFKFPRCPVCNSKDITAQRSIDNRDGSRTKWMKCRKCEAGFTAVFE